MLKLQQNIRQKFNCDIILVSTVDVILAKALEQIINNPHHLLINLSRHFSLFSATLLFLMPPAGDAKVRHFQTGDIIVTKMFFCPLDDNILCAQSLVPPDPLTQFHLRRGSPDEEFPDLCRNSTWMGRILTPAMYRRQFHRCTHSGVIFDDVIRPGLEEPGDVGMMSGSGWLSENHRLKSGKTFKER